MDDVTQILESLHQGHVQSADVLLPLVYDELRKIAAHKMSGEASGHTLQPTALVHEAWLRMVKDGNPKFENRGHFFAVAAEAMRRILIESARRKRSLKRGNLATHEELEDSKLVLSLPSEEILAVNDALDELVNWDPVAADLVKLRYFMGMNMEQAADALGLSLRTAGRIWTYSKAWLRQKLDN